MIKNYISANNDTKENLLFNISNTLTMKIQKTSLKTLVFLLAIAFTCQTVNAQQKTKAKEKNQNMSFKPLDVAAIERVTGMKGIEKNGEYKISIPQNDLDVTVDGFKIIPAMGLGSWVAFTPSKEGAMVMGDIIVTETDLKPVQQEAISQGLTISAIHNHFIRNHPNIMYMHVGGMGNTAMMAEKIKAVLNKVKELRGGDPSKGTASNGAVANTLDTKKLDAIVGSTGEMAKGVYKYTIGRPDVHLMEHGVHITTFFGFNTWAAWQGTPEKAAVAGDFTMLENEVEPVIKALVENGIEVVALHNHMVHEKPRIFFYTIGVLEVQSNLQKV